MPFQHCAVPVSVARVLLQWMKRDSWRWVGLFTGGQHMAALVVDNWVEQFSSLLNGFRKHCCHLAGPPLKAAGIKTDALSSLKQGH